ncbi:MULTISPECIES: hypothetical protein [Staphylococcus]|uniref:hypothetical protein n=1 Tax=Staphylococcus TaxID=1279 RepID=UPI0009B27EB1|nr:MULTISPECIES: hypothetical protein [Staphylococcus]RIO89395.1 hypothetical protein BUZ39_09560 [Staphylococcus haemolyticus]MDM7862903.1 hypothetical protein [Staphylococcus borealis]MDM7883096.1 hypothetical protein [Staphylococcus borealis]MEB6609137.1 hypothetical protein [Staphylococcus borealis]MEB7366995.1 hypothetical protein [Staphylococcus borealis]
MNDEKLTYILLIIASLFLILNGIFAFEHHFVIILMSIFFIIIGVILLVISIRLLLKSTSKKS